MDKFLHDIDLAIAAVLGVWLAFLGALARLLHEHAHGGPFNWFRVAALIPASIIMGVLGHAVGQYLAAAHNFPEATPLALSGPFGYLGPTIINEVFQRGLETWKARITDRKANGKDSSEDGK